MSVLLALVTTSILAATPEFTVQTIDGRQARGTLHAWDENHLVFQLGDRREELPLDQLFSITSERTPIAPSAEAWVTLVDGSVIASQSYQADAQNVQVTSARTGPLRIPAPLVAHVRLQNGTPELNERFSEILQQPTDQDVLVIVSGSSLDYLKGIVRAVRTEEIDFELDGDVLPVRRGKVFAIRYYRPAGQAKSKPTAHVTDDSGSVWAVARAAFAEADGKLALQTPSGLRVSLPLDALDRIDFAGGGLVFLSSLTPDSWQWTHCYGMETVVPSLEPLNRPRMDMGFDSGPLVLDGIEYQRGLALRSRTELTYRLTEPFQRFQALAGIDDHLRPRGNVELKVLGNGRPLYVGTIAGTDSARPVDVDLKGVTTLTLVVDFGRDLDVGDYLILAEAKLLK